MPNYRLNKVNMWQKHKAKSLLPKRTVRFHLPSYVLPPLRPSSPTRQRFPSPPCQYLVIQSIHGWQLIPYLVNAYNTINTDQSRTASLLFLPLTILSTSPPSIPSSRSSPSFAPVSRHPPEAQPSLSRLA